MVYDKVYNRHMEDGKFAHILNQQLTGEYFTAKELQYSTKAGLFLSPLEYQQYLAWIETSSFSHDGITFLPLKTFNSKCIYFCFGNDLQSAIDTYFDLSVGDFSHADDFSQRLEKSRIYSEIEGSVNIENVPTTTKRLKELLEEGAPAQNKNDTIIKNMKAGIDFVRQLPAFNRENLFHLYSLLSKDCLDQDDLLKPGDCYRYDGVEIDSYPGCPYHEIASCMDSLFTFVNQILSEPQNNRSLLTLLPHICHYYLLYIHPYFDFNGRTARMVSYWVYLLSGLQDFPPVISEAINQTKHQYYRAIENSRDAHNDITYFLLYLLRVANDYVITYQNLEALEKEAKNKGYILTETELNYMKKILISYGGAFTYVDFLKMAQVEMTKQGALKILNKLVDYGFLREVTSKSKVKLFDINQAYIPFRLKNFGFRVAQ